MWIDVVDRQDLIEFTQLIFRPENDRDTQGGQSLFGIGRSQVTALPDSCDADTREIGQLGVTRGAILERRIVYGKLR